MTFRIRVITATIAAAAIAVIIACFASYFTTRTAVLHSVDESLIAASKQPLDSHYDDRVTGSYSEIVLPNGETDPPSDLPIDATIMSSRRARARRYCERSLSKARTTAS